MGAMPLADVDRMGRELAVVERAVGGILLPRCATLLVSSIEAWEACRYSLDRNGGEPGHLSENFLGVSLALALVEQSRTAAVKIASRSDSSKACQGPGRVAPATHKTRKLCRNMFGPRFKPLSRAPSRCFAALHSCGRKPKLLVALLHSGARTPFRPCTGHAGRPGAKERHPS